MFEQVLASLSTVDLGLLVLVVLGVGNVVGQKVNGRRVVGPVATKILRKLQSGSYGADAVGTGTRGNYTVIAGPPLPGHVYIILRSSAKWSEIYIRGAGDSSSSNTTKAQLSRYECKVICQLAHKLFGEQASALIATQAAAAAKDHANVVKDFVYHA